MGYARSVAPFEGRLLPRMFVIARSNAAKQSRNSAPLDCFASLPMTKVFNTS
jgi:hypothetical protein